MIKATGPRSSSEVLLQECSEIEEELAALKIAYEQYFMGMERFPPTKVHDALKKRVGKLRTALKGSTAAKFRAQSLVGKFQTYERLWERTLHEIENGTYKRDLFRLKRKQTDAPKKKDRAPESEEIDSNFDAADDLESAMAAAVQAVSAPSKQPERTASGSAIPAVAPLVPPVAPARTASGSAIPAVAPLVPPVAGTPNRGTAAVARGPAGATPNGGSAAVARPGSVHSNITKVPSGSTPNAGSPAASRPPPSARPASGPLDDGKLRAVYDAYVNAKRQCREDTSKLSYESVADNLRKQVPALMKQHGAKSVDFKVVIKDGKAVLRAIPK